MNNKDHVSSSIVGDGNGGGNMKVTAPGKIFQAPTLLTIKQFCRKYPAISAGMIYKAAFHSKTTGIVACGALMRMSGRGRYIVDEEKMLAFMRAYSRKLAAAKPDPEGERKRPAWATK